SELSFGSLLSGNQPAHPISSFALAGYLGYATLASVIGIPRYREGYARNELALPFCAESLDPPLPNVTIIGLGQLGQAYLALMYFLVRDHTDRPFVILIDKEIRACKRLNPSATR